jgi:hypothetical protein
VAQRFTAATTSLFSVPALAAEVTPRRERYFFRKLFSRAVKSLKMCPRFSAGFDFALKGHDFSRAVKSLKMVCALAPEVRFLRPRRVFP